MGSLTLRAGDFSAIGDNGGGFSVVFIREMSPVWLERVFWASEHESDVVGMVLAAKEVSVISDEHGHGHLHSLVGLRTQNS